MVAGVRSVYLCVCLGGGYEDRRGKKNERRLVRSCRGNGEQALVSPAGANRDNERVLKGGQGREGETQTFISPSILCSCPPCLLLFLLCFRPLPFFLHSPSLSVSCSPMLLFFKFIFFHFKHLFKQLFPFQLHRLHSFQQLPAPYFPHLPLLFSFRHLSISTFIHQSILPPS